MAGGEQGRHQKAGYRAAPAVFAARDPRCERRITCSRTSTLYVVHVNRSNDREYWKEKNSNGSFDTMYVTRNFQVGLTGPQKCCLALRCTLYW